MTGSNEIRRGFLSKPAWLERGQREAKELKAEGDVTKWLAEEQLAWEPERARLARAARVESAIIGAIGATLGPVSLALSGNVDGVIEAVVLLALGALLGGVFALIHFVWKTSMDTGVAAAQWRRSRRLLAEIQADDDQPRPVLEALPDADNVEHSR